MSIAGSERAFYEQELDEELRLYDESNPVCAYYHLPRKRRLETLLKSLVEKGSRASLAADVGCGTGPYLPALLSVADTVLGVELARSKARVAKQRTDGRARMVVGSATELPIDDATCDIVLCSEVIEHFPDPTLVIGELVRITKPRGHVLLSTPVRYDAGSWLRAMMGRRTRISRRLASPDQHGHYWYFAPFHVEQMLEQAGGSLVSFGVVPRFHLRGLPTALRRNWASPAWLERLGRMIPARGALGELGGFGIFLVSRRPSPP